MNDRCILGSPRKIWRSSDGRCWFLCHPRFGSLFISHRIHVCYVYIYGNIYHQYIPNVSIYTIHGSLFISTSDTKSVDLGSNSLNLTVPDSMCTSFPWQHVFLIQCVLLCLHSRGLPWVCHSCHMLFYRVVDWTPYLNSLVVGVFLGSHSDDSDFGRPFMV